MSPAQPNNFGIVITRRMPPAVPWWVALMTGDEDGIRSLIREIEVEKGRMTLHERECALYRAAQATASAATTKAIEGLSAEVSALVKGVQSGAWQMNWRAWMLAGAIIMGLLAALTWTGGQLYSLEPGRVHAAQVAQH